MKRNMKEKRDRDRERERPKIIKHVFDFFFL